MVTKLPFPGPGFAAGQVVAQAHQVFALFESDAVVGIAITLAGDVVQTQRMSKLVQDGALQKADIVPNVAHTRWPVVPGVTQVHVCKQTFPQRGRGERAKVLLTRLDYVVL